MKLILDFDDVLFNAKELKEILFASLVSHGIHNAREFYAMARKSGEPFSLRRFLYNVTEYKGANDIHRGVDVDALYNEIMSACSHLGNQELIALVKDSGKDNCYIVTNGDDDFQRDKIRRLGISALVKEIHVVSGSKKEKIEEICRVFEDEDVIFVDDKNKFFTELDMEACPNLKTVIYNENGLDNLIAEIEASKVSEQSRNQSNEIYKQSPAGPGMR